MDISICEMWRVILVLVILSGCQTANNIRPIEFGPYQIKFSYNEWYGGNQWPGMNAYAETYCGSIGKSLYQRNNSFDGRRRPITFNDNSLNTHITFLCFTAQESSWASEICNRDAGQCRELPKIFLAARGVDTRSQMQKQMGTSATTLLNLPRPEYPKARSPSAPAGDSSWTYKAGSRAWTDTIKGICPASSDKGGLIGVLVR